MTINEYCLAAYNNSIVHGFYDGPQNEAEKIALMHSELSEALEGLRKPGPDTHCPEFPSVNIELADVLIRIFDYCGWKGIDLEAAVHAKMTYNANRPYKHGKAF